MDLMKRIHITFYLLLASVFASQLTTAQELKSHNVIIKSSFYEKSKLTKFQKHDFDLRESTVITEPYAPQFFIRGYQLPDNYSYGFQISSLSISFGELSELFLGDLGVFENGLLLYLNSKYEKAEKKILSILPLDGELGERASILMAWIKHKQNKQNEALVYLKKLLQSDQRDIVVESYFLKGKILLAQQSYDETIELFASLESKLALKHWDGRLYLTYLIALLEKSQWTKADRLISKINRKDVTHSKLYYKIAEIAGIIEFQKKQYEKSLSYFQVAKSLYPTLEYQNINNRRIAWCLYFLQKYQETLSFIEENLSRHLLEVTDEMLYLKIAGICHLKKWGQLNEVYSKLKPDTVFFTYASFIIQTYSLNENIDSNLRNKVLNIKYDFPTLKFQASLKEGNLRYKQKQYSKAENEFLKALSVDVNNNEYYVAQYNLGLTYLQTEQFNKANALFSDLEQTIGLPSANALYYHLLYSHYQQEDLHGFLERYAQSGNLTFSPPHRNEIEIMRGNVLLSLDRNQEAFNVFIQLFRSDNNIDHLEKAVVALYKDKQFKRIIDLLARNPNIESETLYIYEVKSLLGTKNFSAALKKVSQSDYSSEEAIRVKLEVWLANEMFEQIVIHVTPLLNQNLADETRLLYYLSLGDAYYNIKQYEKSKAQFYKAIQITEDSVEQSLIQYNLALISYFSNDRTTFVEESKMILANRQLSPEIRYNLTQLLVDHYQQANMPLEADAALETYISENQYLRTKAFLKRLQLLYQYKEYLKCESLSYKPIQKESTFQRRDRLIFFGYCSNELNHPSLVIQQLKNELTKTKSDYRSNELKFILARAYFLDKQYKPAYQISFELSREELDSEAAYKTKLLLVDSLIHLDRFDEAERHLQTVEHYRDTKYYIKALNLFSEIKLAQKNPDNAIRSLLRIYYLEETSEQQKKESLLRIAEISLSNRSIKDSKKYFEMLENRHTWVEDDLKARYSELQERYRNSVKKQNQ